ncbi:winged helix-turn-helix domain-containing protein [Phormidium sp. FACHB-1136]|nr:winged helix-turn-helix domain-containing protein [Phormidium sp. FACHB-1136]
MVLEVIDKEPQDYGYAFGTWTAERLASHLEKETGIKLSGSQVRRILVKKNMYISGQSIALRPSKIRNRESSLRPS